MYRKSILAAGIVCAIAIVLVINRGTSSQSRAEITPPTTSDHAKSRYVPPHLPYLFMFEHLNRIRAQAEDMKKHGKDGSGFQQRFKEKIKVNDQQFRSLDQIAEQVHAETARLDQDAQVITEEFHKKYPPGAVPEGVIIPPPPPKLLALQEMRTNAILRARERVKNILGEDGFDGFDENLKQKMLPNIQPLQVQPQ